MATTVEVCSQLPIGAMFATVPALEVLMLRFHARLAVVVAFAAPLAASLAPAHAGRTLEEPKEIQKLSRSMPAAQRRAALTAAKMETICTRSRLKTREIKGLHCRLALYAHQTKQIEPTSIATMRQLLDAARRAEGVSQSIATYRPVSSTPGLKKDRYQTHKMACGIVTSVLDRLARLPATASAEMKMTASRIQSGAGDAYNLTKASCDCTKGTVSLAATAGVSIDERGELQGQLTSRGCLLNKGALAQSRGGPSGFTGNAAGVAAASTEQAQLLEYAKARDIGLNRCREKYLDAAGKVTRKSKMKACACDEIKRWRFPKKRGRKDLSVVVPISNQRVGLNVTISAPGKVKACGDLVGTAMK